MGSKATEPEGIRRALEAARSALGALQWSCDWRVAPTAPADPAQARPDTTGWPTYQEWFLAGRDWQPGDNWLYATVTFPAEVEGVRIEGSAAAIHLGGWHPFSLFFEGVLVAQEERPWLSTGPALLPLPEPLRAGHPYQVTLRLPVPNHGMTVPFGVNLRVESVARALEEVDTLLAELSIAETLAESPADQEALARAYDAIDLDAVIERRWEAAAASFAAAEAHLAPLSARAKAHTIHLLGHSHIDMNWMWTWDDTVACILRDFHSVTELMRDYPELTFSHSQVATYAEVKQRNPALWAEVCQRVAEGRWEVVAPTWVEGDLNLANGEAIARHFLYAIRWCRAHLGVTPKTMWEPDTFGHPGNIPQLARLAGIERYFHMRCNPALPDWWPAYWWEGIDGSRLLATSRVYNGEISPAAILDAFQASQSLGSRSGFHLHGVGDHGGGPVRANLETLRRLQARPLIPTLRCSTMEAFTTELLREGVALPVHRGESSTVFEGCYTTHADIKRFNREGENRLLTAEALAALAGVDERAPMADAWQQVLFNQFHDLLDGSGIHPPYDECAEKHAAVLAAADAATEKALTALAAAVDTRGDGPAILVVNPLAWERTDVVRVSGLGALPEYPVLQAPDGSRVPGQRSGEDLLFLAREVPALGHAVYHLLAGDEAPAASAVPLSALRPAPGLTVREEETCFVVETPLFRAVVGKDSGIIGSLVDKRCGRELNAYGVPKWGTYVGSARPDLALNVFQVTEEAPHGMSAWLANEVHTEHSLLSGATVEVVECGPVRAALRVTHTVRSSRIVQQILFYRDLARIDFETVVDWQEVGTPQTGVPGLKVAFTARLNRPEATYEIPFGAVARPTDGQDVPALRWADVSGDDYGISLLNDGKYGYDALGSRLRLALLRSSYDPDPVPDCGEHRFRYSLYPHPGTWREADTVRQGVGFNQPLLAHVVDAHAGHCPARAAGITVTGLESVLVSSLKCPEEGDGWILRLYESQGRAGSVTLRLARPLAAAALVNLLEETQAVLPVNDGAVSLSFRPWEVKTLRLR